MARSVKKGPYVLEALQKKVRAMNERNEKRVMKTWSRASTVTPEFVGHTFAVHNGNKFPSTSPRTWSGTSSASSLRRVCSVDTRATRPRTRRLHRRPRRAVVDQREVGSHG